MTMTLATTTTIEKCKHAARVRKADTLAEFLSRSAIASLLEVAAGWSQHDWNVMAKRAGLVYRNGSVRVPSPVTQELVIERLKGMLRSELGAVHEVNKPV